MKRSAVTLLLAGLGSALGLASPGLAQTYPPRPQLGAPPSNPYQGQGPAVSPYINLLRPGSSTAVNYYGLVRPQFEFGSSIQGLQQQALMSQQEFGSEADRNLPTTGHPVGFMTQAKYFNTLGHPNATSQSQLTTFKTRPQLPSTGNQTGYPVPR